MICELNWHKMTVRRNLSRGAAGTGPIRRSYGRGDHGLMGSTARAYPTTAMGEW